MIYQFEIIDKIRFLINPFTVIFGPLVLILYVIIVKQDIEIENLKKGDKND
jgi:hypothetical protein